MDLLSVIWLALVVVFLLIALGTMTFTNLWLAGGALAALICALVGGSISFQVAVFGGVSIILLAVMYPYSVKHRSLKKYESTASMLSGESALVTERIDNSEQTGKVKVGGQIWQAGTESGEAPIPEGSRVKIRKVRGGKLIVEEEKTVEKARAEKCKCRKSI